MNWNEANLKGCFKRWEVSYYGYFRRWRKDGTWLQVHDKLYQWVRVAVSREASQSEAAFDSQSFETATIICTDVAFDPGKQIHGRKRFSRC